MLAEDLADRFLNIDAANAVKRGGNSSEIMFSLSPDGCPNNASGSIPSH